VLPHIQRTPPEAARPLRWSFAGDRSLVSRRTHSIVAPAGEGIHPAGSQPPGSVPPAALLVFSGYEPRPYVFSAAMRVPLYPAEFFGLANGEARLPRIFSVKTRCKTVKHALLCCPKTARRRPSLALDGNCEFEGRALVQLGLYPDAPAMKLHHPLTDR